MSTNSDPKRIKVFRIALIVCIALYLGLYTASVFYSFGYHRDYVWVWIGSGAILVNTTTPDFPFLIEGFWEPGWSFFTNPRPYLAQWLTYGPVVPGENARQLCIPLWLPLLPLLALAALLIYRDRTRRSPGHCPKCNYNLTGNTSGRCPECGTVTEEAGHRPVASTLES
jgi:hypothetical protein